MTNILSLLFAFTLIVPLCARGDDWVAPENPKPSEILSEARKDAQAKRYSVALAKHVWFHENALKYDRSLRAVRLSFALSDWVKLGKVYPPAREKLIDIRDAIEKRAQDGEDVGEVFQELSKINEYLGDYKNTVECFKALEKNHPDSASSALLFAKKSILRAKDYPVYAKYIKGTNDFHSLKETYELSKSSPSANGEKSKSPSEYVEKVFRQETTILVAVLSKVGRNQEANEIAKLAKKMIDDKKFQETLDAALKGDVPELSP